MANFHEVKVYCSTYLAKLQKGESIVVCKRNVPQPLKKARPIGLAKGTFDIPDIFFDSLPEDIIDSLLS